MMLTRGLYIKIIEYLRYMYVSEGASAEPGNKVVLAFLVLEYKYLCGFAMFASCNAKQIHEIN